MVGGDQGVNVEPWTQPWDLILFLSYREPCYVNMNVSLVTLKLTVLTSHLGKIEDRHIPS